MTSAYKEHPIRASVSRILEMIEAPEFAEPDISDNEQYAFARDKVMAMTHALEALLYDTPDELTSSQALGQLQNNIQAPLSELTAFLSNKNPVHICNAAVQFEQNVIPYFWGFAPQLHKLPKESWASIFSSQAAVSRKSIRQLVSHRDDLAHRLKELANQTNEQAAKLDLIAEGAARERAEAVATVAKLEQLFAQKEAERATHFEAAINQMRNDFVAFESGSRADSAALIESLENQRSIAAQLVQVVGNIGVTGNYQQIANNEAKQANFWRWATVIIFGAGVGVAMATFAKFWGEPFSVENAWSVAIRLLYAIAITAPAWYTARESARHRSNSDRARQTELELASIGPFIELMPEDKKVQIREQLTTAYFGRTVEAHTVSSPFDAAAVKDMVVEIAKSLKG